MQLSWPAGVLRVCVCVWIGNAAMCLHASVCVCVCVCVYDLHFCACGCVGVRGHHEGPGCVLTLRCVSAESSDANTNICCLISSSLLSPSVSASSFCLISSF